MNKHKISVFVFVFGLIAAATAQADHPSPWGEGWASMPNDIHNTRVDTMDDDNDAFIDFVRMGAGADSVNRFSTDDVERGGSDSAQRGGSSRGGRS